MSTSHIEESFPVITQNYKHITVLEFEQRELTFDKIITCLRQDRKFIPVFIKCSIIDKRLLYSRFIPMIKPDSRIPYWSFRNIKDDIYNVNCNCVIFVSNNLNEFTKTKLLI